MSSLSERALGLSARLSERELQEVRLTLVDGTRVTGMLHRTHGTRTMDHMNKQTEDFIAMTNAVLVNGDDVERVSFVAINKQHIVRLIEA